MEALFRISRVSLPGTSGFPRDDYGKSLLVQRSTEVLKAAFTKAIVARPALEFLPMFNFVYKDSHSMLTMGGIMAGGRKGDGSGPVAWASPSIIATISIPRHLRSGFRDSQEKNGFTSTGRCPALTAGFRLILIWTLKRPSDTGSFTAFSPLSQRYSCRCQAHCTNAAFSTLLLGDEGHVVWKWANEIIQSCPRRLAERREEP